MSFGKKSKNKEGAEVEDELDESLPSAEVKKAEDEAVIVVSTVDPMKMVSITPRIDGNNGFLQCTIGGKTYIFQDGESVNAPLDVKRQLKERGFCLQQSFRSNTRGNLLPRVPFLLSRWRLLWAVSTSCRNFVAESRTLGAMSARSA